MDWSKEITKWLEEGEDGADKILDYPWDIDQTTVEGQEKKILITATHPKIPFNIEVVIGVHFANLVINPVIPTDAMDPTERMRLYKKLLHLNSDLNLMKAGLVGYDDSPIIQVDLDLESLNKHEFNDALTLLIIGANNLIKIMGLTQEMQEFMASRFLAIVASKLQEGEKEEEIMDFLVNRGGLDEDSAKNLFDQTTAMLEEQQEQTASSSSEPGPMYG